MLRPHLEEGMPWSSSSPLKWRQTLKLSLTGEAGEQLPQTCTHFTVALAVTDAEA